MRLFTIGFTQKTAQEFFDLLKFYQVQRLVDIRLRPQGQLAGFAKQEDLPYFLENLASQCRYIHLPILAPTKDILEEFRESRNWSIYELKFERLMDERNVPSILNRDDFETQTSCLLCSEPTPEKCHRRLVAERLGSRWTNVEIIHL